MDQTAALPTVTTELETARASEQNDRAHVASRLGIVGVVLLVGVLTLTANALITAIATPDFMPDDVSDDPFVATCLACVLPLIFGVIGLFYGIAALRVVTVLGERTVAIRGLVLGIFNVLLPIAIGVIMVQFDVLTAACGGG
jgi:hypothetical protein